MCGRSGCMEKSEYCSTVCHVAPACMGIKVTCYRSRGNVIKCFVHSSLIILSKVSVDDVFLPRCMECRHGLAMRICPSVCPSVCLSNVWIMTKRKKKYVQIFIPYERSFSLVFWQEEWLIGGDRFYLKFWSTGPPWSEIADFEQIIAGSASAVTPIKKSSINTNRKSHIRAFQTDRSDSHVVQETHQEMR